MNAAVENPPSGSPDEVLRHVVANIIKRVGRRVRGLVVLHRDNAIVVRGEASSYYDWQLVIAECQGALTGLRDMRLDCVMSVEQLRQ